MKSVDKQDEIPPRLIYILGEISDYKNMTFTSECLFPKYNLTLDSEFFRPVYFARANSRSGLTRR